MKKVKGIGMLMLAMLSGSAIAQQDAMFSQYMFNYMNINPAYAGSRDVLSITALGRYQWANLKHSPKTFTLTADMPVSNEKIGLGVALTHDEYNVTKSTTLMTNYAYRLRMGAKITLAMGLNAGLTQYTINFASLQVGEGVNAPTDGPFSSNVSSWKPNIGAGVYLNSDRWYLSVSAPHMLKYNLLDRDVAKALSTGSVDVRNHYFGGAGYVIGLSEMLKLKPSVLCKFVNGAPLQADGNLNLWIREKFGIGASYRTGDAIIGMLEFQASPQFRLGFAYDQALTRIRQVNNGSYELMLRYELGKRGHKDKILSPRYF